MEDRQQQHQRSGAVSVAINPVALVVQECITVTSAMRKHARWAHSSVAAILGGGAGAGAGAASGRRDSVPRKGDAAKANDSKDAELDDIGLASRWGLRGKKGQSMQDNPLLAAFARLRSDLKQCRDIHTVDAPAILHPFLQVIRSSSTSAPITSLALIAITKFLAYNIISKDSPQLPLAMQRLSSAVTHCRFEASDSATDEIVLFRILKLMEGMITGPTGDVIGDESMCEMMETGISMCCQVRLSELLRRSAEVSMVTMCQTIFERLKSMDVEPEEMQPSPAAGGRRGTTAESDMVKMDPSISGDMLAAQQNGRGNGSEENTPGQSLDVPRPKTGVEGEGNDASSINGVAASVAHTEASVSQKTTEIKPYSLPSIRELFRVLVDLLDPHERAHNDTMRVMALRIVDVALEVAGPSIASHPSLASLAKDTLCRHLFQLVRSENIAILNESLRVAGTLLSTCRRVLKLQQELFLSYLVACLHPRVEIPHEAGLDPALYAGVPQAPRLARPAPSSNSGRATPVPVKDRQRLGLEGGTRKPDAREAMVESVGALVRIPSFMAELFVNYDCEIDRSDLCLDMVGLLARNAFPDAATWSTTNVPPLCLDALLGYVQSLADRLDDGSSEADEALPSRQKLQEQRDVKRVIIKGATKFNEKPRDGIAFLASKGIISDVDDPKAIASFLKGTTRIDKKVLGEFISKRGNEKIQEAFFELFDFSGMRMDEALRQLLNAFRLPGEAPLIERIVTEFSAHYYGKFKPQEIAEQDGVYVLTYAVIMLNTDQHNPNIKQQARMSLQQFSRNVRGVNAGKDFDPAFLEDIYESIRTREIILPEEHDNRNSFDHAWKDLLFKINSTSDLHRFDSNVFDADMFAATWKPVVATLSYVFMSATDDTVYARVVAGFDQCAQIAARYGLHDALDHIIFCLASISTLASEQLPNTSLNTEVQVGDKGERRVMVSETAVRFGRDFKAQLATVVLFRVVVGNESCIRDGWTQLVRVLLNLFINSLISAPYSAISSNKDLSPIPLQSPAQVIERGERAEGGLFSAFTSYVSSFANDEPPEPSEQEIEYTLCTVDCITACSFDKFFHNIGSLPFEALQSFHSALIANLPEDSSPQIIVVKPELPAPTPVRPNGAKAKSAALSYEPGFVFALELATILAARDATTVAELGKPVADALMSVVRDASHMHPVTLSRAVYYLLSFLRASHEHDFVRAPVVLHAVAKFDQDIFKQASEYVVKGIQICLSGGRNLRNEMANSPDFWSVVHSLQMQPETAQSAYDIALDVVDGPASALTTDNYSAAMALLGDFATLAANLVQQVAAEESARRNKSQRQKSMDPQAQAEQEKQQSEVIGRGVKAVQTVLQLTSRIPPFIRQSQLEPAEAWTAHWSPPFRVLTTHSLNPCRPIRSQALSALQRVLLSATITEPDQADVTQATMLFTDVLFPLINQLLKPEVWHSDPSGMGETRLQAALLCCKVYLRYLDLLLSPQNALSAGSQSTSAHTWPASPSEEKGEGEALASTMSGAKPDTLAMGEDGQPTAQQQQQQQQQRPSGVALWSRILQTMERLIKSGGASPESALDEAIPESIKNILLVMTSGEFIVPPTAGAETRTALQKKLWDVSSRRLEAFLPELLPEILPPATEASPAAQATSTSEGKPAAVEEKQDASAEAETSSSQSSSTSSPQKSDEATSEKA